MLFRSAPAPTPFPGMPGAEPGAVAASAPAPAGCGLPETHVPAEMTATEAVPGLHAADLVLALGDGPETHKSWEHAFRLQLRIRLLPQQLDMQLVLDNTDTQSMRFTAALHTYLAVPELPGTTLDGLEGSTRLDTLVQPNRQEAAPSGPLLLRGTPVQARKAESTPSKPAPPPPDKPAANPPKSSPSPQASSSSHCPSAKSPPPCPKCSPPTGRMPHAPS